MAKATWCLPDDEVDCRPGGFGGGGGAPAVKRGWLWYGAGNSNLSGDSGCVGMDAVAPPAASLLINNTDAGGVDRGAELRGLPAGTVITLRSDALSLTFTVASVVPGGTGPTDFVKFTGTTVDNGLIAGVAGDKTVELTVGFS